MDASEQNRLAWNKEASENNYWTRAVGEDELKEAREGRVKIRILPNEELPLSWLSEIKGKTLALASGGGQEGPLLAAMGSSVIVTDISDAQLERDREVASKYHLDLKCMQCDLGLPFPFEDNSFDSIINPISINFTPNAKHVWKECSRVLKKGGVLITAFANPVMYIFDVPSLAKGKMKIKYTLPFDADKAYTDKQKKKIQKDGETMEYSHTLNTLLGDLCKSGFIIKDLMTGGSDFEPVDSFIQDCYIALLATKV